MPKTTYRAQEISIKTDKGINNDHYNVFDDEGNKVATCYKKANADLVVNALNAHEK